MFDPDHLQHALHQRPFRCDRPRYAADEVQVACRGQGLVQGALSRLAGNRDRPQVGAQIFGHDLVAGRSASEASQEDAEINGRNHGRQP